VAFSLFVFSAYHVVLWRPSVGCLDELLHSLGVPWQLLDMAGWSRVSRKGRAWQAACVVCVTVCVTMCPWLGEDWPGIGQAVHADMQDSPPVD